MAASSRTPPGRLAAPGLALVALLIALVASCGAPPPPTTPAEAASPPRSVAVEAGGELAADRPFVELDPAENPLDVTEADPSWGDPWAPVTIVEFVDLECPF
jgi:protein-disulfide isomerase